MANGEPKERLKKFVLLINQSGQLISISDNTKRRNRAQMKVHLPQLEAAMRAAKEIYLWFPREKPTLSFMDALKQIRIGSALEAEEIEGHFVLLMNSHSPRGTSPLLARAAWAISLRGTPPIRQRTALRHVIDDATGRCFYANSVL